jgi:hypothetical protein
MWYLSGIKGKIGAFIKLFCQQVHNLLKHKMLQFVFRYEVWQKSNATGNAVREPTMLLPPPSRGS